MLAAMAASEPPALSRKLRDFMTNSRVMIPVFHSRVVLLRSPLGGAKARSAWGRDIKPAMAPRYLKLPRNKSNRIFSEVKHLGDPDGRGPGGRSGFGKEHFG